MSLPHAIMWAVVLVVGMSSAWRNPTAGALVLCWVVAETIFVLTGDSLAVEYYAYPDIFVLAVIFAKREWCNLRPYKSTWHQLKCVVLERSPADRIVMLIFPVMWVVYVLSDATLHPYYRWWILWALAIAQFVAAAGEAVYLARRDVDAARKPENQHTLLVAYPAGGRLG